MRVSQLLVCWLLFIETLVCVEKWDMIQIKVVGPREYPGFNPFNVKVWAILTSPKPKRRINVNGFYNGNGSYIIRFMPDQAGNWQYFTESDTPNVEDKTGSFKVSNVTGNNKGPVYAVNNVKNPDKERPYFAYAEDGSIFFESGTTSYGWIQLPSFYTQQTINTIKYLKTNNIFNKIRMAVFPLVYKYTHFEPESFPFTGSKANNWNNFTSFNLTFWSKLDNALQALQNANIIIDLIIFHPYDHGEWGFDCMGGQNPNIYDTTHDMFYMQYLVARVGAYRNIWWSMANEYDLIHCKNTGFPNNYKIWDEYFMKLVELDPYNKEKSIHQGQIMYNYTRPWTTHFSVQGHEFVDYKYYYQTFGVQKALILDEVQYEGNCSKGEQLTALQEVNRFWEGTSLGMQVGHSEAVLPNKTDNSNGTSILWWNYGNILRGESYKKIKWYYQFMINTTIHPPFHQLFTHCYVTGIENQWQTNFTNITGCYVSQLYDKNDFNYYMVRWVNISNTASTMAQTYNTTINIKLAAGEYKMYEIQEWNENIFLLNDSVKVIGNNGFTFTPPLNTLPFNAQFIRKNSKYKV